MPKSSEFVRNTFEEARHLGATALDAIVDTAQSLRLRTQDMPVMLATEHRLHQIRNGIDNLADKIWDELSKH